MIDGAGVYVALACDESVVALAKEYPVPGGLPDEVVVVGVGGVACQQSPDGGILHRHPEEGQPTKVDLFLGVGEFVVGLFERGHSQTTRVHASVLSSDEPRFA